MIPVYGFRLLIFLSFSEVVVDTVKTTSYNVARDIIYEWGTCTGAIKRLRLEIVNIETMHQLLVVKKYFKRNVCLFHFLK